MADGVAHKANNMYNMSREELVKLVNRKKELEVQIEEHGLVLKVNKTDMFQPLTDDEGYPRNDIDVISVRKARHAINCLQTTRLLLMVEIETGLDALHQNARNNNGHAVPMETDSGSVTVQPALQSFAFVESVEPGLLADRMGIQAGDRILQIGSLSARNFKSLNQIQTVLANSQGQNVRFMVRKPYTSADVVLEVPIHPPHTRLGIKFKPD